MLTPRTFAAGTLLVCCCLHVQGCRPPAGTSEGGQVWPVDEQASTAAVPVLLPGPELQVSAGDEPRLACRATTSPPSGGFIVLVDTQTGKVILVNPPSGDYLWETVGNWFDQGQKVMAIAGGCDSSGQPTQTLVTLDRYGNTLARTPLMRPVPYDAEPPVWPLTWSVRVDADGHRAAVAITQTTYTSDLQPVRSQHSVQVYDTHSGCSVSSLYPAALAPAAARNIKMPFFDGSGRVHLVMGGSLLVTEVDVDAPLHTTLPSVAGAWGVPDVRWATAWGQDGSDTVVFLVDTDQGGVTEVWRGREEVLHAESGKDGRHLLVVHKPDGGSFILRHVDVTDGGEVTKQIHVVGRRPGVRWVEPGSVAAVADTECLRLVDMRSGGVTLLPLLPD